VGDEEHGFAGEIGWMEEESVEGMTILKYIFKGIGCGGVY
jgi:hypothetical protein